MDFLIIINDAPYGSERPYNALRYATALMKKDQDVKVFLMADSVACGLRDQKTPEGYYNIGKMLMVLLNGGISVHACGTCMDARGLNQEMLIEGVMKSTMNQLTDWSIESDKIVTF